MRARRAARAKKLVIGFIGVKFPGLEVIKVVYSSGRYHKGWLARNISNVKIHEILTCIV